MQWLPSLNRLDRGLPGCNLCANAVVQGTRFEQHPGEHSHRLLPGGKAAIPVSPRCTVTAGLLPSCSLPLSLPLSLSPPHHPRLPLPFVLLPVPSRVLSRYSCTASHISPVRLLPLALPPSGTPKGAARTHPEDPSPLCPALHGCFPAASWLLPGCSPAYPMQRPEQQQAAREPARRDQHPHGPHLPVSPLGPGGSTRMQ